MMPMNVDILLSPNSGDGASGTVEAHLTWSDTGFERERRSESELDLGWRELVFGGRSRLPLGVGHYLLRVVMPSGEEFSETFEVEPETEVVALRGDESPAGLDWQRLAGVVGGNRTHAKAIASGVNPLSRLGITTTGPDSDRSDADGFRMDLTIGFVEHDAQDPFDADTLEGEDTPFVTIVSLNASDGPFRLWQDLAGGSRTIGKNGRFRRVLRVRRIDPLVSRSILSSKGSTDVLVAMVAQGDVTDLVVVPGISRDADASRPLELSIDNSNLQRPRRTTALVRSPHTITMLAYRSAGRLDTAARIGWSYLNGNLSRLSAFEAAASMLCAASVLGEDTKGLPEILEKLIEMHPNQSDLRIIQACLPAAYKTSVVGRATEQAALLRDAFMWGIPVLSGSILLLRDALLRCGSDLVQVELALVRRVAARLDPQQQHVVLRG